MRSRGSRFRDLASRPRGPVEQAVTHNGVVAGSSPSSPTTQSRATRLFPVSAEHPGFSAVRTGRIGPFTVSVRKEARPEVVWGLSSLASGNPFPGARRRRIRPGTDIAVIWGIPSSLASGHIFGRARSSGSIADPVVQRDHDRWRSGCSWLDDRSPWRETTLDKSAALERPGSQHIDKPRRRVRVSAGIRRRPACGRRASTARLRRCASSSL